MGKGIQLADSGLHGQVLDDFKDQLLIVFLKALASMGHDLRFPLAEVDDTSQDLVSFRIEPRTQVFEFSIIKKV